MPSTVFLDHSRILQLLETQLETMQGVIGLTVLHYGERMVDGTTLAARFAALAFEPEDRGNVAGNPAIQRFSAMIDVICSPDETVSSGYQLAAIMARIAKAFDPFVATDAGGDGTHYLEIEGQPAVEMMDDIIDLETLRKGSVTMNGYCKRQSGDSMSDYTA